MITYHFLLNLIKTRKIFMKMFINHNRLRNCYLDRVYATLYPVGFKSKDKASTTGTTLK